MYQIAIVDDNETWCFVLSLRLEQQGYAVSTFTEPRLFLREADRFDLVLIDFSIPTPHYQSDMDGPEVICRVKHQLENPPTLVLMSSFFTENLLKSASDLCPEADAILSKQVDTTEFFASIQKLLKNKKRSEQQNYCTPSLNSSTDAEAPVHK